MSSADRSRSEPQRRTPGARPAGRGGRRQGGLVSREGPSPLPPPNFHGTVIYVHGTGNKPIPSVLKCQWDRALFRNSVGEQSRMVYWVCRQRYPNALDKTSKDADFAEAGEFEATPPSQDRSITDIIRQSVRIEAESMDLSSIQLRQLDDLAEQLSTACTRRWADDPARTAVSASILPTMTRLLVRDVHDYLMDAENARRIDQVFRQRLTCGGGPFIVVAHGFGSVIAYRNLCQLGSQGIDTALLVTMGSPLGLTSIQEWLTPGGSLTMPPGVQQWRDFSDSQDVLTAADRLRHQLAADARFAAVDQSGLNVDSPQHPHSATGYLQASPVHQEIRSRVGLTFDQEIREFAIANDVSDMIEDASPEQRHEVLIQVRESEQVDLKDAIDQMDDRIRLELGSDYEAAEVIKLNRYLAAKLTGREIERLGAVWRDPDLQRHVRTRIWSDSQRSALISVSGNTVQTRPAWRSYGATGQGITWAVLDSGIRWDHPHFQNLAGGNVAAVWDCLERSPAARPAAMDNPGETIGKDRNGHGTHVAGIIAGAAADAEQSNMAGMAPAANIHSYKVLGDDGRGTDSGIIKALDHIAAINQSSSHLKIHGVNLSLGGPYDPRVYGCGHSPICQELRRLWNSGVIIVISAGNAGFAELQSSRGMLGTNMDLSIGDPANLEEAISVGSVHKRNPLTYGVSFFSSRGPTADGRYKPDLVAPGEKIVSASHRFDPYHRSTHYVQMSGTSMAAPHVSGLLAAFLSLRREFIGYPDRVKSVLLESCTDLGRDRYIQGAGMPNLVKMLLNT